MLDVDRTMVSQLLEHERIETTLPKAKELRKVADKMITLAKEVREAGAYVEQPLFFVVPRPLVSLDCCPALTPAAAC